MSWVSVGSLRVRGVSLNLFHCAGWENIRGVDAFASQKQRLFAPIWVPLIAAPRPKRGRLWSREKKTCTLSTTTKNVPMMNKKRSNIPPPAAGTAAMPVFAPGSPRETWGSVSVGSSEAKRQRGGGGGGLNGVEMSLFIRLRSKKKSSRLKAKQCEQSPGERGRPGCRRLDSGPPETVSPSRWQQQAPASFPAVKLCCAPKKLCMEV